MNYADIDYNWTPIGLGRYSTTIRLSYAPELTDVKLSSLEWNLDPFTDELPIIQSIK